MGLVVLQKTQFYDNIEMLSTDDKFLCYCSAKKANWYLSRNLAVVVEQQNSKLSKIKLLFKEKAHSALNSDFSQEQLQNHCVVCGSKSELTRHHVVPYVFRKRFNTLHKEHDNHDVLLVCEKCHTDYEHHGLQLKKELALVHGVAFHLDTTIKVKNKKILNARALLKKIKEGNAPQIPIHRIPALEAQANLELLEEEESLFWADKICEHIKNDVKLIEEFNIMWRSHFVEKMNPQYLPKNWNIYKNVNTQ